MREGSVMTSPIDSGAHLPAASEKFVRAPRAGEVYNIGGSRHCNCSILEAIELCEEISGRKLQWQYQDKNRIGDVQAQRGGVP